jgi:hypothetical protein
MHPKMWPDGVSTATKKGMLEYPEGVGRVTEAERVIEIDALAGATEGVAETPPVFAKVTGRSGPKASKRAPAISEARSVRGLTRTVNTRLFHQCAM